MEDLREASAEIIRRARSYNNWTQEGLALRVSERLGRRVTKKDVSRYETGQNTPPADFLLAAWLASGFSFDSLFHGPARELNGHKL